MGTGMHAIGILCVEVRSAAKHTTLYRTHLTTKNSLVSTLSSAEVDK